MSRPRIHAKTSARSNGEGWGPSPLPVDLQSKKLERFRRKAAKAAHRRRNQEVCAMVNAWLGRERQGRHLAQQAGLPCDGTFRGHLARMRGGHYLPPLEWVEAIAKAVGSPPG